MSRTRIFAYGSNMHPNRMLGRVSGAVSLGRARLRGYRLVLNKRGRDGSAKANLSADAEGLVWGVVWELSVASLATLDGHESGYERVALSVHCEGAGGEVEAEAYLSARLAAAIPFDWYMDHLVRGARAHGLPEDYVAWLESLPSRPG